MDRLWTKGDRIEVLGIGQSRMSCLRSEVTLGQFLAESWIGVVKSASHYLSQSEIGSDNPLFATVIRKVRLAYLPSGLFPDSPSFGKNTSMPAYRL